MQRKPPREVQGEAFAAVSGAELVDGPGAARTRVLPREQTAAVGGGIRCTPS
jgi:hypothetical protein